VDGLVLHCSRKSTLALGLFRGGFARCGRFVGVWWVECVRALFDGCSSV
jgi:hypothetical protein